MTYEYICRACGHQWEAQQAISADPLKDCPQCGEPRAQRQISRGGGFILKGGGWYSDLYASSPSGSPSKEGDAKPVGSSSGDSAAGPASKSDAPAKTTATPAKTTDQPTKTKTAASRSSSD